MILISVDLPAPFSPISACTLPGSSVRSTFSSASTPGKALADAAHLQRRAAGFDRRRRRRRRAGCQLALAPLPHEVEIGGQDDDDAGDHHLQVLVPAEDDDAVVDDLEHQNAEQRAEQRAAPAGEAGAAEDDGGDRPSARSRGRRSAGRRSSARPGSARRGRRQQPGDDEGEELQPLRTARPTAAPPSRWRRPHRCSGRAS